MARAHRLLWPALLFLLTAHAALAQKEGRGADNQIGGTDDGVITVHFPDSVVVVNPDNGALQTDKDANAVNVAAFARKAMEQVIRAGLFDEVKRELLDGGVLDEKGVLQKVNIEFEVFQNEAALLKEIERDLSKDLADEKKKLYEDLKKEDPSMTVGGFSYFRKGDHFVLKIGAFFVYRAKHGEDDPATKDVDERRQAHDLLRTLIIHELAHIELFAYPVAGKESFPYHGDQWKHVFQKLLDKMSAWLAANPTEGYIPLPK